jgi:hypothetical protein
LAAVAQQQQMPKSRLPAVLAVAVKLVVLKAAMQAVVVPAAVPTVLWLEPVALAVPVSFRKKALKNARLGLARNLTNPSADSMKSLWKNNKKSPLSVVIPKALAKVPAAAVAAVVESVWANRLPVQAAVILSVVPVSNAHHQWQA